MASTDHPFTLWSSFLKQHNTRWVHSMNSSTAVLAGTVAFVLYQRFWIKDTRSVVELLKAGLRKIPLLGRLSVLKSSNIGADVKPKPFVSQEVKDVIASLPELRPGLLTRWNPFNWKIFNRRKIAEQEDDQQYQAGEDYGDSAVLATGLEDDLKAIGLEAGHKALEQLIELVKSKGKPIDDKKMAMEKLIAIAASLPPTSKTRKKLTGLMIDTLWSSLQHPPLSYLGDKFQYRTADGSYNNPLQPDLGKAGTPYAKTVKKLKALHGTPPDPGMLFDLLMARPDDGFKENPAGISSVLFYHATIIIHDIFCSNKFDNRISDTSSYLDLAPLYGSSVEDQLKIRTMQGGKLKPDTFHERRLLGQPPGVNVMLVMYSRFHNFVADTLLKINEYGRFTVPPTTTPEEKEAALKKQDNDLFQTARLIVGGLYVNISLHDYLRGLTNSHHSATSWTLDPRIDVERTFDKDGVPRGCGNQVSAEFNLLYRFHSTISLRDEKWLNEFMERIFADSGKPIDQLTPEEFFKGLYRYEQSIPKEPSQREFGGLKRGPDGRFNNAELVKIMKDSMEDPAGLFGARMVPKALKMVEIAGILSARKWQLASLNEMRDFFGLKRHDKFEDINPDPQVAGLLRKFYNHPDMVEMYPGLFMESAKPRMDPGCGGCPPYTVGRAVFSDAVTLVRSDRFYTLDYTASTLTNWGMTEVKQDYEVLGGSMFYKLFQRTLPGWFPYNSLHVTQPMFTRKMNEQIAREIGTFADYNIADPAPPPTPLTVDNIGSIKKILQNQACFIVPWAKPFDEIFPGKKSYSWFMLAGDTPAHAAQRKMVEDILYKGPEITKLVQDTVYSAAKELLSDFTMDMGPKIKQIDIVRDFAIPLNNRVLADLFCLDLKTSENPNGTMDSSSMYKHLSNVRTWGFEPFDAALALNRRVWTRKGCNVMTESTTRSVNAVLNPVPPSKIPIIGAFFSDPPVAKVESNGPNNTLREFGKNLVRGMAAAGTAPDKIIDICWLSAVAGVGAPIGIFVDVVTFFLKPENTTLWETVQKLAASPDIEAADKAIRAHVLEAQRLTSEQRVLRYCIKPVEVDGVTYQPRTAVVCLLGKAGKILSKEEKPEEFILNRPMDRYPHFADGPHRCLGREVCLILVTALVKLVAGMKNLRSAPGDMGTMKSFMMDRDKVYLNSSWSYLTAQPTTWTVHFDGYGEGVYEQPAVPVTAGRNLDAIFTALKKQDAAPPVVPPIVKDASTFPPPPVKA